MPATTWEWASLAASRMARQRILIHGELSETFTNGLRRIGDNLAVVFFILLGDNCGAIVKQMQGPAFSPGQAETLACDGILSELFVNRIEQFGNTCSRMSRDEHGWSCVLTSCFTEQPVGQSFGILEVAGIRQ